VIEVYCDNSVIKQKTKNNIIPGIASNK